MRLLFEGYIEKSGSRDMVEVEPEPLVPFKEFGSVRFEGGGGGRLNQEPTFSFKGSYI